MKRTTKQIIVTLSMTGAMFFFYHIHSMLFVDVFVMTEEQYARAAQEIVNGSLPLSPCATNTTTGCPPK